MKRELATVCVLTWVCLGLSACGGSGPVGARGTVVAASAAPSTVTPPPAAPTGSSSADDARPTTPSVHDTSSPTAGRSAPAGSTSHSPTAAAPPTASAAESTGCALPHTGDLILWEKWPGLAARAGMSSDVDYGFCRYAWETLDRWVPAGPGYCNILARPADNPGYDRTAVPPPPPARVLARAGEGC